jgi:glycosyltransferase involved in cell wall biosynthesis
MKILFVNHTFPPESLAGSEIYVLHTALALQKLGHDVAVFYRFSNPDVDEYTLREDTFEGIPVYKINHTYRFTHTFQDLYINPAIAAKFSHLLYTWKPDVVHFNHTTNLSMSLVQEAKTYGCGIVYTLHDYWLLCQRGQMLRRDLSLCDGPSHDACRSCLSLQLLRGRKQRLVAKCLNLAKGQSTPSKWVYDLRERKKARVTTPDKVFVRLQSFGMGDKQDETLQAHPPASIAYPITLTHPATLKTAIGLHPHTYHEDGGGVIFRVLRNNETLFTRCLNPKKNPQEQGWHPIDIPLAPSLNQNDTLTLVTEAETDSNMHCTAGWRMPAIESSQPEKAQPPSPRKHSISNLFYQAAMRLTDAVARFSGKANEGIHHRKNCVQRIYTDVDLFIAPSRFLMRQYTRHGLPESKIVYADYGFPIPATLPPKEIRKPLRFGYLGTWIPSKGVEIALRAFQDIDPAQAKLRVYGFFPGGYDGFEDYDAFLRSLAGPAVELKGKYNPADVYSILSDFDCLIMPSIWYENSPLTIHEAFLANVPVITSGQGGMAELLQTGGGATFTPRSETSLREVVNQVIADHQLLENWRATIPEVKSCTYHASELIHYYHDFCR